jgi:hypothetical protein
MKKWLAAVLPVLALAAAPALAVDGVREINAVCALNTGCIAGDTPGYPVTIGAPGSYRLTGDLNLTDSNTDAIRISSRDVSIDLNGFTISGITVCAPSCTNVGVGRGVGTTTDFVRGLSVRNGTVSQMGGIGIEAGQHSQIEDVRAISNGSYGIRAADGSLVQRCTVSRNGNGGIVATAGAVVADNTVTFARGTEAGILTGGQGVVRNNAVYAGLADGILVGAGSVVTGNSLSQNDGDGIESAGFSRLLGNTAFNNDGYQLRLTATDGYSDNTIGELAAGNLTVFSGLDRGGNSCNAAATCP